MDFQFEANKSQRMMEFLYITGIGMSSAMFCNVLFIYNKTYLHSNPDTITITITTAQARLRTKTQASNSQRIPFTSASKAPGVKTSFIRTHTYLPRLFDIPTPPPLPPPKHRILYPNPSFQPHSPPVPANPPRPCPTQPTRKPTPQTVVSHPPQFKFQCMQRSPEKVLQSAYARSLLSHKRIIRTAKTG